MLRRLRCPRKSRLLGGCCICCIVVASIQPLFLLFREVQRHVRRTLFSRRSSLLGHVWEEDLECHWPSSLGHDGSLTSSKHTGPGNLTAAFAWVAKPHAKWASGGQGGTSIDGKGNIYLSAYDRVQKYSPDGRELWTWRPKAHTGYAHHVAVRGSGTLWGGAYLNSGRSGNVFALSMATGAELWSTQFGEEPLLWAAHSFVSVHEGIVVLASDWHVLGFDAGSGKWLWAFQPDVPAWTFLANFPGDGTFAFQDWEGSAYRCNLADGSLVWRAGGNPLSWTSSPAVLGPNSVLYAPFSLGGGGPNISYPHHLPGGALQAFALEDGQLLWERQLPRAPQSAPAVGRLAGGQLAVVQPIGQGEKGQHQEVHALDARTGRPLWVFQGPQQAGVWHATGDLSEGEQANFTPPYSAGPWSAATIDAEGTVYVGCSEGVLFALRDADGNGRLEGADEVQTFETGNAFTGSESLSISPGLAAIASADWLWVFKW